MSKEKKKGTNYIYIYIYTLGREEQEHNNRHNKEKKKRTYLPIRRNPRFNGGWMIGRGGTGTKTEGSEMHNWMDSISTLNSKQTKEQTFGGYIRHWNLFSILLF